jgi:hypothetical protein
MLRSIFLRLIKKVLVALLFVQAGCEDPASSPAQFKDSLETERDSLIPPLFTKAKVLRRDQVQFVGRYGFAENTPLAVQVDFPDLCNQLK